MRQRDEARLLLAPVQVKAGKLSEHLPACHPPISQVSLHLASDPATGAQIHELSAFVGRHAKDGAVNGSSTVSLCETECAIGSDVVELASWNDGVLKT